MDGHLGTGDDRLVLEVRVLGVVFAQIIPHPLVFIDLFRWLLLLSAIIQRPARLRTTSWIRVEFDRHAGQVGRGASLKSSLPLPLEICQLLDLVLVVRHILGQQIRDLDVALAQVSLLLVRHGLNETVPEHSALLDFGHSAPMSKSLKLRLRAERAVALELVLAARRTIILVVFSLSLKFFGLPQSETMDCAKLPRYSAHALFGGLREASGGTLDTTLLQ